MSSKLAKSSTPKYILKEINTNRNKIKNICILISILKCLADIN